MDLAGPVVRRVADAAERLGRWRDIRALPHLAAARAATVAVQAAKPHAAEQAFGPGGILVVLFPAGFAVACIGAGA